MGEMKRRRIAVERQARHPRGRNWMVEALAVLAVVVERAPEQCRPPNLTRGKEAVVFPNLIWLLLPLVHLMLQQGKVAKERLHFLTPQQRPTHPERWQRRPSRRQRLKRERECSCWCQVSLRTSWIDTQCTAGEPYQRLRSKK